MTLDSSGIIDVYCLTMAKDRMRELCADFKSKVVLELFSFFPFRYYNHYSTYILT